MVINMLEYKGYLGSIEYDPEEEQLLGRFLHASEMQDLQYRADSFEALEQAFRDEVDRYLDACAQKDVQAVGIQLGGVIPVEMSPDLPRQALLASCGDLSDFIQQAIRDKLQDEGNRSPERFTQDVKEGMVDVIHKLTHGMVSAQPYQINNQVVDIVNKMTREIAKCSKNMEGFLVSIIANVELIGLIHDLYGGVVFRLESAIVALGKDQVSSFFSYWIGELAQNFSTRTCQVVTLSYWK